MPYSDPASKQFAYDLIKWIDPGTVLDVGPGAGVYGSWIKENLPETVVEAIEIWEPYVARFGLEQIYDRVIVKDVREMAWMPYDLVIFGDVLEHMTEVDALNVWEVSSDAAHTILSIPTVHWPQGEEEGNPYEAHVEDHWSVQRVLDTFPGIVRHQEYPLTSVFLRSSAL